MATRDFLKHIVSTSEPTASSLGDEWYNPSTNRLYKRVVTDGTTAVWSDILNNPNFANDIIVNGLTVGRGDGNLSTNTAFGLDALGSAPDNRSTNINNVAVGTNALNKIGVGVATVTVINGGSGYNDGEFFDFTYQSTCTFDSGTPSTGTYPTVIVTVVSGVITSAIVINPGVGFTSGSAVTMTVPDYFGYGGSGALLTVATWVTATNNTAIGFNAGNTNLTGSNSIYIGHGSTGTGSNQIIVGSTSANNNDNIAVFGPDFGTTTTRICGQTVNLGNSGGTVTLNIGTSSGTTIVNIAGTATSFISPKTVNISTGGNSADTINIGRIAAAFSNVNTTIRIGTEPRSGQATTVNIGTGVLTFSGNSDVNIGSNSGNSSTTINGNIFLDSGSNTLSLGSFNGTGSIFVGSGDQTQTVNINAGATASARTKTVNIGNGGLAGSTTAINIGSTLGTSTTILNGSVQVTTNLSATTGIIGYSNNNILVSGTNISQTIDSNQGSFNWLDKDGINTPQSLMTLDLFNGFQVFRPIICNFSISSTTGTASNPAFLSTTDTNTGMFFPAADTLAFTTGGSERMRIDASGRVGIGVSNPTAHLELKSGSAVASSAPLKLTAGTNLTTAEAGAFEYDGIVPYFTSNVTSGRGYLPAVQVFGLSANGAAIGPAISNFFGANSAVNLAGGGKYEIEAYCYFTKTTAGTVTVTATTSLAPAILNGTVDYGAAVGGTATGASNRISLFASTATNSAFGASVSLTTGVNHCFTIRLILSSNVSASNLRINFTSSAGTVTPLRESYYKVTRLPSANVGSFAA